jgi:hypothetical protein
VTADHLEVLVEEPSIEAFLRIILPAILPQGKTFEVYPFQGKQDLLGKLPDRLRGYQKWLPANYRIVVVVDRDDDDCLKLKSHLEEVTNGAGLSSRTVCKSALWQVANRIAIEELEAWYFGDWEAVCLAYPRTSPRIPGKAAFRDPDAILGGTWESLERVLQKAGYFSTGLRKLEIAREVGRTFQSERCTSKSFSLFRHTISEAFGYR